MVDRGMDKMASERFTFQDERSASLIDLEKQ